MDNFFDKVATCWEKFKSYIASIRTNWAEGRKARAVGKVILPLVPAALAVVLLMFLWAKRAIIVKIFSGALILWSILYSLKQEKSAENKPGAMSDAEVMKFAKQGLNALLDHVFMVCESLAEQTEIYSPKTKSELAYPDMKRCIHIEDGVAVISFMLNYEGEINTTQFLERFNDVMAQKLNSGELWGHPPAVFYDKDNDPHTSIQAIRCVASKSKKYIRLDVIRVNQAALALMDKVSRENAPRDNGEEQLYDDQL